MHARTLLSTALAAASLAAAACSDPAPDAPDDVAASTDTAGLTDAGADSLVGDANGDAAAPEVADTAAPDARDAALPDPGSPADVTGTADAPGDVPGDPGAPDTGADAALPDAPTSDAATGQDTSAADVPAPDTSTWVCVEDTVGSTPGLITLGGNGLVTVGQTYPDLRLCDPFLIDYFKFDAAVANTYSATVFHDPLPADTCFLVGVLTDPADTDTLIDATTTDFTATASTFAWDLSAAGRYYLTVLRLSPCAGGGDLQETVYGLKVDFAAP